MRRASPRAFAGRWLITETDERDEINLLGSAHFAFIGKDSGELEFIAIQADLDLRYGARDGAACAEFSWEGFDALPGLPSSRLGHFGFRWTSRRPYLRLQRRRFRLHRRT